MTRSTCKTVHPPAGSQPPEAATPPGVGREQRLADGAACLQSALDYLALGWSPLAVCPPDHAGVGKKHATECEHAGKAPWGPWKAFQFQRPTEDELRRKWRDNPTLNVGIALGPVSGLVRIDVDGPEAERKLALLSGGDLPATLEFTSGRPEGGRGLLFRIPPEVEVRTTIEQNAASQELRFQARGAQTVLPPSRHVSGTLYRWVPGRGPHEINAALMPAWLIEELRVKPKKAKTAIKRGHANGTFRGQASGADDFGRIAAALQHVTGADEYTRWLDVGMALHDFDAGPLSLALWCDWSSRSDKYTREVCEQKWGTFTAGGGRTIASIFHWSMEERQPSAAPGGRCPASGKTLSSGKPESAAGPTAGKSNPVPLEPTTAAEIILAHYRERLRPVFKRGTAVVCRDGSEVQMAVALAVPDSSLIQRLIGAVDAPRMPNGMVKVSAIPGLFKTWRNVAWGDLLNELPEEDAAMLGDDAPSREQFRQLVREAMLSEVTLGDTIGENGITHTERRSLAEWCQRFAWDGPWRDVRSKRCWCKYKDVGNGEIELCIAIRHELFAQLKADRRLRDMGPKRFARLASKYGVGQSLREERPHGQSAITLDRDFVADLVAGIPDEEEAVAHA